MDHTYSPGELVQMTTAFALLMLVLIGFSLLLVLQRIAHALRKLAEVDTSARIHRLEVQTKVNKELVSDPKHLFTLVRYVASEAALQGTLDSIEEEIEKLTEPDGPELNGQTLEYITERVANPVRKKSIFRRAIDGIKKHKGKFAEKLFGKLNDLVKGFLPGSSGGA